MSGAGMDRKLVMALAVGLAFAAQAFAQTEIFVCVDDDGRKTFQNTGNSKGCKKLDVGPPAATIPAPKVPPQRAGVNAERATPASFPRVEAETQRARDSDRRRILEDEVKGEEERLARLRAEYNSGEPERNGDERNYARYQERVQRMLEDIQRSENNLVALRRELALMRQ